MAESLRCRYNGREISVEEARRIKQQSGKNYQRDVLTCIECGLPVKPHQGGGHVEGHFEHWVRNPECSLSHRKRNAARNEAGLSKDKYDIEHKKAIEGYEQDRVLTVKKRDRNIVEQRKRIDKYTCQACGFLLKLNGSYVIECHHLEMVAKAGIKEVSTEELVCLCPTCHRIAHLRKKPYSVEEIRAILGKP